MKRKEELKELSELSAEDLSKKVADREHELMNLRFRHASGQLTQSSQLKKLRRSIARGKTIESQNRKRAV